MKYNIVHHTLLPHYLGKLEVQTCCVSKSAPFKWISTFLLSTNWATVYKTVRFILSDYCLSVLSCLSYLSHCL